MGIFFESYIFLFFFIVNKNNDIIELNFVIIDVNLECRKEDNEIDQYCYQFYICVFIKEILIKVFYDFGGKYYKNI